MDKPSSTLRIITRSKTDSGVRHENTVARKGRGRGERVRPTCGRSGDASEGRAVDVQVWIVEVRRVSRSDRIQPELRGNAFLYIEPPQNVQIEIEDARASPIRDAVHAAHSSLRGIREKHLSVVGHCFERAAALKTLFCCQRIAEGIVHLTEHVGVVEENSVTRFDD